MARDWWNPKEARATQLAGMAADRRAKKHSGGKKSAKAGFYKSHDWLQLRYWALATFKKCGACGRGPKETVLHVDHIKPRSKFPELELSMENVQVLCRDCNTAKGSWDQTDWR